MHILEQYALSCGLKIGNPYIYEKIYPTPFEKYITFNPFGKFESRKYDYWQEVIDIITPYLEKKNIKIIQIGGPNEYGYQKCFHLMGQTNFNQTAFIIKNSLLHFGVDSFPIHLASSYNKKIVALYCNMYSSQSKPYWSNNDDIRLIEADLKGKKPSYAPQENPKTINNIKPEYIAKNILNLLNINTETLQETIFIGNRYGNYLIESLPKDILAPQAFPNQHINIRFDYIEEIKDQDSNGLFNNLNIRPCSIITDKPINLQPFLQFKDKIVNIFYNITKEINMNFVNDLKFFGGKVIFIFDINKSTKEVLDQRKYDLIDYQQIIQIVENKAPEISVDDLKNCKYKSSKFLIGNNQVYLSKAAYLEDKPVKDFTLDKSQDLQDINNIQLFLEEDAEFCLLFK